MSRPPTLSDRQLKVFDVLTRAKMAWIAFWVVMGMFVLVFGCFVYSGFWRPDVNPWMKGGMFLLDGVLGWSVKHIIGYLFPKPPSGK